MPSTIYYTGNQRATPRYYARTVTAVAAAATITATINSKTETYTCTAADTPTTAAANALAAFQASPILELQNFTFASYTDASSNPGWSATGPADGMPLAITFAAAGGATLSSVSTIAPTSPSDVNDVSNYLGAALPGAGDTLVVENTPVSLLYNLGALTAVTFLLVRRASHGGVIGLPDTNQLGYPEYLATRLLTAGTASHVIEDNGNVVRVQFTSASAVTCTVTGAGGGQVNQESVEVTGTSHASSVLNVTGAAVAAAPLTSQSAVFGTVRVSGGVLRTGPGAVLTAVTISNAKAELAGNYTTLVMDRGSTVSTKRACTAATSTSNQGGTLIWGSTGGWGALTIGSDGAVDVSQAPAAITSGAITMQEGSSLSNPYDRITRPYTVTLGGEIGKVTLDIGTAQNFTVN